MDALRAHLSRLERLYSQLKPVDASDAENEAWIKQRLSKAQLELHLAVQEQESRRSLLEAEILDLLEQIEDICWTLHSTSSENITSIPLYPTHISYETRNTLRRLLDSLQTQLQDVKLRVLKAITRIRELSAEMDEDIWVPLISSTSKSWGPSIRDPILFKLGYLERNRTIRSARYEELMTILQRLTDTLQPEEVDAFDRALSKVFSAKRSNKTYYAAGLYGVLSLSDGCLSKLQAKVEALQKLHDQRMEEREHLHTNLLRLWKVMAVPDEDRNPLHLSDQLDAAYLTTLRREFESLRAEYLAQLSAVIAEYKPRLESLWDKCMTPNTEREAFITDLLARFPTVAEAREIFTTTIAKLANVSATSVRIVELIEERQEQIQKMIDFEQSASDPRRLFQSSFRLVQEEKWRKTAWPNLVKIEETLLTLILELEQVEGKPFHYPSGVRYLEVLQMELSDRMANELFFGFEPKAIASKSHEKMQLTLNTIDAVISPSKSTAAHDVAWLPHERSEEVHTRISHRSASPMSPLTPSDSGRSSPLFRPGHARRSSAVDTPPSSTASRLKRLSQDHANLRQGTPRSSSPSVDPTGSTHRTQIRRIDAGSPKLTDPNKPKTQTDTPTRIHRVRR